MIWLCVEHRFVDVVMLAVFVILFSHSSISTYHCYDDVSTQQKVIVACITFIIALKNKPFQTLTLSLFVFLGIELLRYGAVQRYNDDQCAVIFVIYF